MNRCILAIVIVFVHTSSAVQSHPLPITPAGTENNSGPVIFTAAGPTVTDNDLVWRCREVHPHRRAIEATSMEASVRHGLPVMV